MNWIWQQKNWPEFLFDASALKGMEQQFVLESAKLIGASTIITEDERKRFTIDLMSEEALKSSKIEGEILSRDSVATSLLRQFGFTSEYSDHMANDKEKGVAALMVDNYQSFDQPLTHAMMFKWHPYIVTGSWLVKNIGRYRTSKEAMQIVSGHEGRYKVHFEAPPAIQVEKEMDAFIQWFNNTAPEGSNALPALTRAGITHLYFVTIHPFDDGNGRIARALSEKALAQSLGRPALIALSHIIEATRKEYYNQLEKAQKGLSIDAWLSYFAKNAIDAIGHAQKLTRFIVEKSRLFDRVRGQINQRQHRALVRMFDADLDGFEGGLAADNYIRMTGATRRTASRDLQGLVELAALTKTGQLKGTRYWLNIRATCTLEVGLSLIHPEFCKWLY
ncbi:MAG: Fic family protein [Mariprofundus sp.]